MYLQSRPGAPLWGEGEGAPRQCDRFGGAGVLHLSDLVTSIRNAIGSHARIVRVPTVVVPMARLLGWALHLVLLTADEFRAMASGLAATSGVATGATALSDWLADTASDLGRLYANDVDRPFSPRARRGGSAAGPFGTTRATGAGSTSRPDRRPAPDRREHRRGDHGGRVRDGGRGTRQIILAPPSGGTVVSRVGGGGAVGPRLRLRGEPPGRGPSSVSATLVQVNGMKVLIPVGVPLVVVGLVVAALRYRRSRGKPGAGVIAWASAGLLGLLALAGMVTVGIFVVPVAVVVMVVCASA